MCRLGDFGRYGQVGYTFAVLSDLTPDLGKGKREKGKGCVEAESDVSFASSYIL